MKKILPVFAAVCSLFVSCSKNNSKNAGQFHDFETVKSHVWYAFNENGFEKVDLPQNAKAVV
ncbi:MAG: hypothetical protein Q4B64_11295, partial [Spirochaetales bacterium]|nr:hypothetical protein [Spirochaetales bacterium]